MRLRRAVPALVAATLALTMTACSSDDDETTPDTEESSSQSDDAAGTETESGTDGITQENPGEFPITIEHAFGTTVIESEAERVASVNWGNHEVPLALDVVPVGMAAANFGDDDGDGLLPWVSEKLDELGGETPVLFDETDGIDFEAVADTDPDVILAAYSGLTQEDYDTLTEIAPVVPFPESAWATDWRDVIRYNAAGMGRIEDGDALIDEIEGEIEESVARYPELAGTSTMFMTHVDVTDLSTVNFYTSNDTRAAFFEDLGLVTPEAVAEAATSGEFSGSVSAEQVDIFDDVELIVTYGDQSLVDTLKADPVLSEMPAIQNDAIVFLDGSGPIGTAANPTPLSIPWVLDDYVDMLAEAAGVAN